MITIFYGPKSSFEEKLPTDVDITTLIELAVKSDDKKREFQMHIDGQQPIQKGISQKETIDCLVAYSDDYAGLSENAIQSFVGFISEFEISNMYLQNPPSYILDQLQKLQVSLSVKEYSYKALSLDNLKTIKNGFSDRIIGQDQVCLELSASLYSLVKGYFKKPFVILFYGPTGVGKTETAKYISDILGENLFRKQFSMFHTDDFASYLFGGKHSQNCFARELLERESNIILLDEFDKPNPVFHSAFYQLFDEGVFEDKNYHVKMENSIIICTSNFTSEDDIRSKLGDPIYSRFDAIIKFNTLPIEAVKSIILHEYEQQLEIFDETEKQIIESKDVLPKLLNCANQLKNARQIKKVIREAVTISLVQEVF